MNLFAAEGCVDLSSSSVLTKLNISQLKNSFSLFESQGDYEVRFHFYHNFSFYHFYGCSDDSNRLLFYPVTLHEGSEPSACDLFSLLNFIKNCSDLSDLKIDQIIIPFGEKGTIGFLRPINHMITLVIDVLKSGTSGSPHSEPLLPLYQRKRVNVRIIDSLGFSLPFCHQTSAIFNILKIFYLVIKFEREYLGHQSQLDNQSCCFFTFKVIERLLSLPVNTYLTRQETAIKSSIPRPNTWLGTSETWLTDLDRSKIRQTILQAFDRAAPDPATVKAIADTIIEVE